MNKQLQLLVQSYFAGQNNDPNLTAFLSDVDDLFADMEARVALLERSVDLASDAISERTESVSNQAELFDAIFNSSPDALLLIDFDRDAILFNPAFGLLWEWQAETGGEISHQEFFQRLPEFLDNAENFIEFLKRSLVNTDEFAGELLLKDGRWLHYDVVPRLESGRLVGRLWTFKDITEQKQAEKALSIYQHDLRLAHELAHMGPWSLDINSGQVLLSEELIELFQLPKNKQSWLLRAYLSCIPERDRSRVEKNINRSIQFAQSLNVEHPLRLSGNEYYVLLRGGLQIGAGDEPDRLLGVLQDISDIRASEHRMRVSSQFFRSSMQGNILMDRRRHILEFNEVVCRIFQLSPDEFIECIDERLYSAWTNDMSINDIWRYVVEHDRWAGEVFFSAPELAGRTLWLSLEAVRDDTGKIANFIAIFNDITESKRAQEQLHQMAYFDSQTGLPNRFQCEQFLSQKLSSPAIKRHPLVLMYMDLDRFKYVNDSLGHHAGDNLLFLVGQRLREVVPHAGMIARQGGDEFIVLLSGKDDVLQAEAIAQRLVDALSQSFTVFNKQIYVGASIGIVRLPEDAQDMVSAMRYADICLYRAKKSGKGCYRLWDRSYLQDSTPERIQIESELREGIERGELILHYQPKVNAVAGELHSLEALVRWQHPRLGLIYPDSFIGIAEESNLIVELDRWVIAAVAEQQLAWRKQGLVIVPVSLNVSASHITRADLVLLFAQILNEHPELANYIEVELTETAIMADPDQATISLNHLLHLGVKPSVDDFGSGYTSLGYLKKLNANTLKIDRTFIDDITEDGYDRDVAKAIIALANSLSMEVVAEGVETKAQWDLLASFGCQYLQGYYFSKPKPAEEIARLLASQK